MLPPPNELPERAPRLAEGRYVLLARIGKGGMAGVYAAWDTEVDEWRAIKVLFPKHARDRSLRNRFENEAQTMIALNHPNLVRVYDVGRGERLPYMVMELINAGSLYRWTKTYGAMPSRMAVEAMIQLCNGLQLVHDSGVVHRDIKPRNILINWDGALKLTDFGIAQLESSQETRTGLAMGTLGFMSPEQLHDAKSVDLRTDIYAIGATLWAQLTARKARDLFRLEDKPSLMDGVANPLKLVLSKCLAYERDDRYATADELREDFERTLPQLDEDPADAPPLPLNLGAPSLKSKPDNTFSEILTLARDETTGQGRSAASKKAKARAAKSRPRRIQDASKSQAPPQPSAPASAPPPSLPMGQYSSPSITDSRPAHVRLTSGDDAIPSYMVGVEQPNDGRVAELITYTPENAAVAPAVRRRSRLWTVLGAALLAPVALAFGAVVAIGGAAWLGSSQLGSAEQAHVSARDELSERMNVALPVVDDMETIGADVTQLNAIANDWRRSKDDAEKARAAVQFIDELESAAHPLLSFDDRSHAQSMVKQRLDRLRPARTAHEETLAAWHRTGGQPHARLAVRLLLANPPPDDGPGSTASRE